MLLSLLRATTVWQSCVGRAEAYLKQTKIRNPLAPRFVLIAAFLGLSSRPGERRQRVLALVQNCLLGIREVTTNQRPRCCFSPRVPVPAPHSYFPPGEARGHALRVFRGQRLLSVVRVPCLLAEALRGAQSPARRLRVGSANPYVVSGTREPLQKVLVLI